jgi:hypothetical protein
MAPKLERLAGPAWRAEIDGVAVFLDDRKGQPDPSQHAIALRIAEDFAGIRAKATSYLELFVDRAKACGSGNVEWWLEEIELRGMQDNRSRCSFGFTLHGDDGGYWTVEMTAWPHEFRPVRFERKQG